MDDLWRRGLLGLQADPVTANQSLLAQAYRARQVNPRPQLEGYQAGQMAGMVPGLGLLGVLGDVQQYVEKPETRGILNYGLTALGALPFLGAMAKMGGSLPSGILRAEAGAIGQAPKGGVLGLNNAFYKGGQFLPSSAATEKGAHQIPKHLKAGNKAEIEPGLWLPRPEDGMAPLKKDISDVLDWRSFRQGQVKLTDNHQQYLTWLSKEIGAPVEKLTKDAAEAVGAYSRGARWVRNGELFDAAGNPIK